MALEKKDFDQIEQIVEKSATDLRKEIIDSGEKTKTELKKEISSSAEKTKIDLRKEINISAEKTKTELRKEIIDSAEKTKTELRKEIIDSAEKTKTELRKEIIDSAEKTKTELKTVIKEEIENLAVLVNNGFNETQKFNNQRFDKLEKRLGTFEKSQEDIKLRLDNVAYRFELIELQSRVKRLEKKVGIT